MQSDFWDKRAYKYEKNICESPLLINSISSTKSRLGENDIILDVGCGSGEFCLGVSESVCKAIGIDTSCKMIELAENKLLAQAQSNIQFLHSDIFNPSLDGMRISVITAFNLVHLLDNKADFLARVHSILTKGGQFIIETPCLGERNWFVRKFVAVASMSGLVPLISDLTFDELEPMISRSGFQVIQTEITDDRYAIQRITALKQ